MDVMAGSNSVATTKTAMFGGLSIVPQTNGVLKRHKTYHGGGETVYKECLKNHAANMGGHAVDGCGEFMPSQMATATDPRSLTCAACGCHRNFHRRDTAVGATHVIEYHPQHRHLPLPPPQLATGAGVEEGSPVSDDESPPPISSTYYPRSAPQMLLALSSGGGDGEDEPNKRGASEAVFSSALTTTPPPLPKADENTRIDINNNYNLSNSGGANLPYMTGRKRFRTKFSQDQKERMHEFAEKVGWKLQRSNDEVVKGFCNEIGVQREVFKVWMHNNKNTLGRRSGGTNYVISGAHDSNNQGGISLNHPIIKEDYEVVNGNGNGNGIGVGNSNSSSISEQHHQHQLFNHRTTSAPAPTNASSSSS